MNKVWINNGKDEDKIIAINDDMIIKSNPKSGLVEEYAEKLEKDDIPNNVLRIPFSYIKSIEYQERQKFIKVLYGQDSDTHLKIADDKTRLEVFMYFKENIPNVDYTFEKYSKLKAGKTPLIALTIVVLLFAWTFNIANNIEMGYEYELVGNGRSIAGIVLGLAQLGVLNVSLIFGSLFLIALWSLSRKLKNRPEVHALSIMR